MSAAGDDTAAAELPVKAKPTTIRRASVACVVCRGRKIKCDGDPGDNGEPCSQCKQLKRPCVFRLDDHRKRPSQMAYIQRLQERIAALEQREQSQHNEASVKQQGRHHVADTTAQLTDVAVREMSPSPDIQTIGGSVNDTTEAIFRTTSTSRSGPVAPSHGSVESVLREKPDGHASPAALDDFQMVNADLPMEWTDWVEPRPDPAAWSTDARDDIINRLCSTMGQLTVDEAGHLTYFGATSNLHVSSILASSPTPAETLDENLETGLADSAELHRELIRLYFTYHHPALGFIHKETFLADYSEGRRTQYYSEFLLTAVFLRSLRLHSDPAVQALGSVFFARAKRGLPDELENPNIATVQALCLLGDYVGSIGNDRLGWLYPGIAFRLIFDFGLNQDCTDLVTMGYLSQRDLFNRHNALWGSYVFDVLLCLYQGRPIMIRHTELSVAKPSYETCGQDWEMLLAWTNLCTILSDLADIINGPPHLFENLTTYYQLSRVGERLLKWLKSLPEALQWKSNGDLPSPGVCALHMQFFAVMILLHRPFAGYKRSSKMEKAALTSATKQQLIGYTPATSRQICLENATRLARLLLAYRQKHGVEKVCSSMLHMIFVAATALIAHISMDVGENRGSRGDGEATRWLRVCLETLDELARSFLIAGRVRKVLANILECCGCPDLAYTHLGPEAATKPTKQHQNQQQQGTSGDHWAHRGPNSLAEQPAGSFYLPQQTSSGVMGESSSQEQPQPRGAMDQPLNLDQPPLAMSSSMPTATDSGIMLRAEDFDFPDMSENVFGSTGSMFWT